MKKDKGGRPTVMTKEAIQKLEYAFSVGATVLEACWYAGIGKSTYYDYISDNSEFSDKVELLSQKPKFLAKVRIVEAIKGTDDLIDKAGRVVKKGKAPDVATARWYAERKMKDEFSTRVENMNTNVNIEDVLDEFEKLEENEKKTD